MAVATHYPVCATCGSADILRDAWAGWNPLTGNWELDQVFDHAFCKECDGAATLAWKPYSSKERIRLLNDALRMGVFRGEHDRVVMTAGISAQGDEFIQRAVRAVAEFTDFTPDCDPYEEHDFGEVTVDDQKIFFKYDYYGLAMDGLSPDPADPAVTARVLTIMLAHEY